MATKKEVKTYEIGDIVLIPFPFTDLSSSKIRPAIIIGHDRDDLNLVFITSIMPDGLFLKIKMDNVNNLKTDSFIRYSKIATLDKKICIYKLGALSNKSILVLKKSLKDYLKIK